MVDECDNAKEDNRRNNQSVIRTTQGDPVIQKRISILTTNQDHPTAKNEVHKFSQKQLHQTPTKRIIFNAPTYGVHSRHVTT